MGTNRIEWIDTAKGLGLLLVFIGHLKTPYLATWVYTFHMPLFFFLSGLVYKHHCWNDFIVKRFKRLVIPYFVLGSGIFIIWCIIYMCQGENLVEYVEMLKNFLCQRGFWTVWFLAALFVASVLQWIIVAVTKDNRKNILILSSFLCLLTFVYYRLGGKVLPWCIDVACVAQFFMNMGYLSKKYYSLVGKDLKFSSLVIFVLLIINALSGFACIRFSGDSLDMSIGMYGNEILSLISAFSGIGATICFSRLFTNRFITYLGKNSMILFAWHSRIVIVLCGFMYKSLGWFQHFSILEQILYTIITLMIILIVLIPITEFVKTTKYRIYFGV